MKDPRLSGMHLTTYLGNASKCGVLRESSIHVTSENVVMVLRLVVKRFGAFASIRSDNGSCFVGRNDRKKGRGSWRPTIFEEGLLENDIALITARPYRPQTSGKLERFHRSLEEEMSRYGSLRGYIDYYNESKLHFSLDIDNYETSRMAFSNKRVTETIRKGGPK